MKADTIIRLIEHATQENNEPGFGGHIFHTLLAHIEPGLSFDQKTSLMWAFSNTEKALKEARIGNENYSLFYFDQLKKYMRRDSNIASEVYNFIVIPAEAFYEYNCARNYNAAIEMLVESITSINRLIDKEQCYFMQSASAEQYLNICRVLYKQQKKVEAFTEFGQLMLHICTGKTNLKYAALKQGNLYDKWDGGQRMIMLHYFTDVALFKYIEKGKPAPGDTEPGLLFNNLLQNKNEIQRSEYSDTYIECAAFIMKAISNPEEAKTTDAETALKKMGKMPRTMQYIVLTLLLELHDSTYGHSNTLSEQVEKYCTGKLKLGHLFISGKTNSNFTRSPLRVNGEVAVIA